MRKAYIELVGFYKIEKKYDQAEDALKKALELKPELVELWSELEGYYFLSGEDIRAEELLDRISPPEDCELLFATGVNFYNRGKLEQAAEMFKRSLEIEPRPGIYLCLRICYSGDGQLEQAEEIIREGIQLNPENAQLWGALGLICAEQKKYKFAEECFQKADQLRLRHFNPITQKNYQELKKM